VKTKKSHFLVFMRWSYYFGHDCTYKRNFYWSRLRKINWESCICI